MMNYDKRKVQPNNHISKMNKYGHRRTKSTQKKLIVNQDRIIFTSPKKMMQDIISTYKKHKRTKSSTNQMLIQCKKGYALKNLKAKRLNYKNHRKAKSNANKLLLQNKQEKIKKEKGYNTARYISNFKHRKTKSQTNQQLNKAYISSKRKTYLFKKRKRNKSNQSKEQSQEKGYNFKTTKTNLTKNQNLNSKRNNSNSKRNHSNSKRNHSNSKRNSSQNSKKILKQKSKKSSEKKSKRSRSNPNEINISDWTRQKLKSTYRPQESHEIKTEVTQQSYNVKNGMHNRNSSTYQNGNKTQIVQPKKLQKIKRKKFFTKKSNLQDKLVGLTDKRNYRSYKIFSQGNDQNKNFELNPQFMKTLQYLNGVQSKQGIKNTKVNEKNIKTVSTPLQKSQLKHFQTNQTQNTVLQTLQTEQTQLQTLLTQQTPLQTCYTGCTENSMILKDMYGQGDYNVIEQIKEVFGDDCDESELLPPMITKKQTEHKQYTGIRRFKLNYSKIEKLKFKTEASPSPRFSKKKNQKLRKTTKKRSLMRFSVHETPKSEYRTKTEKRQKTIVNKMKNKFNKLIKSQLFIKAIDGYYIFHLLTLNRSSVKKYYFCYQNQ